MKKKKVMIVDDELNFLKITKSNLEQTGKYEVKTMLNAVDILLQIKAFNPDIILLDILMPKVSGDEVCKILSADPEICNIPIITLSALDMDSAKLMMYNLGVVDFLVKPIEKDELIAKIEKALQPKDKKRILIIDDERGFAKLVKINLEKTGRYEVRTENGGLPGIAAAKEFKPKVILLDVMMPGMAGDEVADLLGKEEETKNIPIIYLTAIMEKSEAQKRGNVTGQHYILAKPVDIAELTAAIEKCAK